MASWRQPYRSALRDLAQSLISQAQVKRRNDEQALMLQAQQDAANAQATQNMFNIAGQTAVNLGEEYKRQRQEQYNRGLAYGDTITSYANEANSVLAEMELLNRTNPGSVGAAELEAMRKSAAQWSSILTANPADWQRLLEETLNNEIVPAGSSASIFSAAEIADGTAAATLENPLTGRDILSQGRAYASALSASAEDTEAARNRNASLLDKDVASLLTGIEAGGMGIVNANIAADRIESLLDSGNLPDTVDVDTYRAYIGQARAAIAENPDLQASLEAARAQTTAATEQAEFAVEVIDWEREKLGIDREFYEKFKNLDYDTAVASLQGMKFNNQESAYQAFINYGFVPADEMMAADVQAMYNSNPIKDENGNVLSFQEAQAKFSSEHRELMDIRLEKERIAVDIAGISLDTAKLQYDADEYAAQYMQFDADNARSDQMRTRIANAIVMGDVGFLTNLQTQHADILQRFGLTDTVNQAIGQAQSQENIIELQNTLSIAELNSAIRNQPAMAMAERTAAINAVLQSNAAFMTADGIDNWWAALSDSERRIFGSPEQAAALLQGAKRTANVNQALADDQIFQTAWRRVSAIGSMDIETNNIPQAKQQIVNALTPVLGADAANTFADSFGQAWANGNREDAVKEMQFAIEEAKVNEAFAIFEEYGLEGLRALEGTDLESVNTARQLLNTQLTSLQEQRLTLTKLAEQNDCIPGSFGEGANANSDTCVNINASLVDVSDQITETTNTVGNMVGNLLGTNNYVPNEAEINVTGQSVASLAAEAFANNELPEDMLPLDYATALVDNYLENVSPGERDAVREQMINDVQIELRDTYGVPMTQQDLMQGLWVPITPRTPQEALIDEVTARTRTPFGGLLSFLQPEEGSDIAEFVGGTRPFTPFIPNRPEEPPVMGPALPPGLGGSNR